MSRRLILYGLALIAIAVVILSLLAGVNRILSFVPFTPQWGERTARAEAVRSVERARDLESAGQVQQAQRADHYHHQTVTIRTAAAKAEADIRSLPDAETPLDPPRLDRLRSADVSVCRSAPSLCPAPEPAPGG